MKETVSVPIQTSNCIGEKIYGKANIENSTSKYLYTKRGPPKLMEQRIYTQERPFMKESQFEREDRDVYMCEIPVKVVDTCAQVCPNPSTNPCSTPCPTPCPNPCPTPCPNSSSTPCQTPSCEPEYISISSYRECPDPQFSAITAFATEKHKQYKHMGKKCKKICMKCKSEDDGIHCDIKKRRCDSDDESTSFSSSSSSSESEIECSRKIKKYKKRFGRDLHGKYCSSDEEIECKPKFKKSRNSFRKKYKIVKRK